MVRGGLGRDKRGRDDGRVGLAASRRRLLPEIHLAPESAFQGPPGYIPVPGGTKLGSPGPFSGANCLIINDSRCQVNFTKARLDSIRPAENLSKDDCGKPTLRSGASSPLSERELSLNGCTFVRRMQALFWYALLKAPSGYR